MSPWIRVRDEVPGDNPLGHGPTIIRNATRHPEYVFREQGTGREALRGLVLGSAFAAAAILVDRCAAAAAELQRRRRSEQLRGPYD